MSGAGPLPLRAMLLTLALISPVQAATVAGTYALPDAQPKVSATLSVTPAAASANPGTLLLDVAMARLGGDRPIKRYDIELSKRLHLIAVDEDFRSFLHGHGDSTAADGHFRLPMTFPHAGVWHVYADAAPAGLGQQVMRFDVTVGAGGAPAATEPATPQPGSLVSSDGRYGVRFDSLDLHAGQEAELALHILRDGTPAPDLAPFLGVAAHVVLISASDLTYVHAHAAPALGASMQHDMPGMQMPVLRLQPGATLPPNLVLHVRAPSAGRYLLWLQFMGGGQVRTVPFVVTVH